MVEIPAQPRTVLDDEIIVEYGMFTLQDQAPSSPLATEMAPEDDALLAAGRGGAIFHSAETDHYAAVKIEFWPAEPDALAGQWDAVEQGVMSVESTAIRLRSILAVMTPHILGLPAPGRYAIRAHVRGRQAIKAKGAASFTHGVESWCLQIWPQA